MPAVCFNVSRNLASSSSAILVLLTIGSITSFIVTPCLSSISPGLSIWDKADNSGSTATACSFRVAFAIFLRTGDISLAKVPVSSIINGSSNFTEAFKFKIWSFGNL